MRTDGQTDRQTDIIKLLVPFCNFTNAPKNNIEYFFYLMSYDFQLHFSTWFTASQWYAVWYISLKSCWLKRKTLHVVALFAWNSHRYSAFFYRQLLKHDQKTKLGNVVYFHVEKARKAHLLLQKAIINIYVSEIEATRHRVPSVVWFSIILHCFLTWLTTFLNCVDILRQ